MPPPWFCRHCLPARRAPSRLRPRLRQTMLHQRLQQLPPRHNLLHPSPPQLNWRRQPNRFNRRSLRHLPPVQLTKHQQSLAALLTLRRRRLPYGQRPATMPRKPPQPRSLRPHHLPQRPGPLRRQLHLRQRKQNSSPPKPCLARRRMPLLSPPARSAPTRAAVSPAPSRSQSTALRGRRCACRAIAPGGIRISLPCLNASPVK